MIWVLLAVLVTFGARVWSLHDDAYRKYLEISMKSSVPGVAKIFFDLGDGFTEGNSSTATISRQEAFSEYRFLLPSKKMIFKLRFDPLTSDGHVEIRQIRVIDGLGSPFVDFHLMQLEPLNQISRFKMINDHISVDIEKHASDPQIHIKVGESLLHLPDVHPSYHRTLFLSFFLILLSASLIYLWVNWNDPRNIKKWTCYGLITVGLAIISFYGVQTCLGILNRSIHPFGGGDTEVFLHMAALKWTNPYFYHGLRPPVVPILHSLVNGSVITHNIILLQTIISYVSWIFLAFMVVRLSNDYLVKVFAFFLIAFIPLNGFIHYYSLVILSESLSYSFLAVFLSSYLWYYHRQSIASVVFLSIVALIFAFTRDTDAYRVLLMTLPILLLVVQHVRSKTQGVTPHIVLFILFILIFIGSNHSTSNIHCRDCTTPYMKARWFMPTINNLYQRILPFEDRVKYYEDHGLPVTPELMAMKYKWASSDNWQSAFDPKLAAQGEWNYRHGRQTYMKYLITHPKYVFTSAFEYRDPLLFLHGTRNVWYHATAKPYDPRSIVFLNDDRDLKMFIVLFLSSLIMVIISYVKQGRDDRGDIMRILLTSYIIFMAIPIGLLIFHADLMDLARHSYTNIIQLNLGFVLFYLCMADILMRKMKRCAIK